VVRPVECFLIIRADDDGTIQRSIEGYASVTSTRQVSQTDHSLGLRPAKGDMLIPAPATFPYRRPLHVYRQRDEESNEKLTPIDCGFPQSARAMSQLLARDAQLVRHRFHGRGTRRGMQRQSR
jgi:hypothetical protein